MSFWVLLIKSHPPFLIVFHILYRSAVEEVPDADYEIPLGKAEIMQEGKDVTIVGWGAQLRRLQTACDMASKEMGVSCELIDLRTLLPWDSETIIRSVKKTGKLIVSHEDAIRKVMEMSK